MSDLIENIKERIQLIEKAVSESVVNHNSLLSRMEEAKHFLDMATKAAEAVAPESCETEVLKAVDEGVDAITQ